MWKRYIDMVGNKFGRLTVLNLDKIDKHGSAYWTCKCDCGKIKSVRRTQLIKGLTKSCGCLTNEIQSKRWLKPDGYAMRHQAFLTFKGNAKTRNLKVLFDFDIWLKLSQQPCFYCGTTRSNTLTSKHNSGNFSYNGIDRINNNQAYTIKNSVSCCYNCNRAKSDLSLNEFINWTKKVIARIDTIDEFNRRTE